MMNEFLESAIFKHKIKAIVMGASTGGITALEKILQDLPKNYPFPIIIVQHISPDAESNLINHFKRICKLDVCEVIDLEPITAGKIFFAPPGYHLMIEYNKTFSLCVGEKISYSRPSIDVLFSTAANVYKSHLLGIILTGANHDGTNGAKVIKQNGGLVIAQLPDTAEAPYMPASVIKSKQYDVILTLEAISELLQTIGRR